MKTKIFFLVSCVLCFFVAISVVAEEAKKAETPSTAPAPAAPAKATVTPVALTLEGIKELQDRKASMDEREEQLAERAKSLDVQEKLLQEKLKKMEELNRKMAERLEVFKKDHEQRVLKLVAMVETMKPQAAAEYVENLDPDLAVEILARIQVARAAKILNLVDKKKGARLSELYAGYRSRVDEAPATPAPTPGGALPASAKM